MVSDSGIERSAFTEVEEKGFHSFVSVFPLALNMAKFSYRLSLPPPSRPTLFPFPLLVFDLGRYTLAFIFGVFILRILMLCVASRAVAGCVVTAHWLTAFARSRPPFRVHTDYCFAP